MSRIAWNRNGIRGASSKRPKPDTLPSVEQISELVSRGDRGELLQARDRLLALLRERTWTADQVAHATEIMGLLNGSLTAESVALAERPYDRYAVPQDAPRDPLRAGEDHTLPARVEQAKRALAGGTDEQDDVRERAAEVRRAMKGAR